MSIVKEDPSHVARSASGFSPCTEGKDMVMKNAMITGAIVAFGGYILGWRSLC